MLASAWNFIVTILHNLEEKGLADATLTSKLTHDTEFRERYLALYDMVNELVTTFQAKFSVLAINTRKAHLPRACTITHTVVSIISSSLLSLFHPQKH